MEITKIVLAGIVGGILHYNGAQLEVFDSMSHLITVNILFFIICNTIAYIVVSTVFDLFGKIFSLFR